MPPSLASEKATIQDPLIGYAVKIGWVMGRYGLDRRTQARRCRSALETHSMLPEAARNIGMPTALLPFGIFRNVLGDLFQLQRL